MNNSDSPPIMKDLVLIGGGHSHLFVLKHFAMNPIPGVRLTLITRDLHTPYSGMLPGFIAGHYSYDQAHIDLRPLTQFAKARIFHEEVSAIHLDDKKIICSDRPPIHYDVASINIGSTPNTLHIPGAKQFTIPVKPINNFLSKWDLLVNELIATLEHKQSYSLSIVGGGAGGIEMALAAQYRLHQLLKLKNIDSKKLEINLYCDTSTILPSHNSHAREIFYRVLKERNINIYTQQNIISVDKNKLTSIDGTEFYTDSTLWITNASAPNWLADSGLEVDSNGFITVNDCSQSISHKNIFAAGDIASVINHPREKSGVFAVRQGPPLAKNLARAVKNKKLIPFKPQKNFLGLISTGDKYAVASRGNWSLEGVWLWKVKDWIDLKFMDKFNQLPEMKSENLPQYDQALADKISAQETSFSAMRCGGCGAKVGQQILSRVINRLNPVTRDDVVIGLSDPDDAAVTEVADGKLIVQSVDYFRSFIDDPYLFGQIAANHALSDLFAMGAETQSALAIATIPYGIENQIEEQLFQTMSGALSVLNKSNTALVGGHSSEGAELSFGLSVTGLIDKNDLMRKSGMQSGDVLILTKPLGTGTLFAADMRLKAKGRWIDNALISMLLSNQAAGICLHKHGATACTDITGFGLLGHLLEMTRITGTSDATKTSAISVDLNLDALPILDGALETMAMGIFSSLQEQNLQSGHVIKDSANFIAHQYFPLLFDPQTSGGLLAAIPAENAVKCLTELKKLGYSKSTSIGIVTGESTKVQHISLRTI